MKKLVALISALALVAALAIPALAATKTVKVGDDWFVARTGGTHTVVIRRGSSVKFRWVGKQPHNVYQLSGPKGTHFHTPTKRSGTYTRKYTKRGLYKYFCSVHPFMRMNIRVK